MSLGAVTPEPMALLRASPGSPLVGGQKGGKADRSRGCSGVKSLVEFLESSTSFGLSATVRRGNQMSSKMARSENVLEVVPDALVGMDQTGVIRFVNHQTESLFGYDRDDLVGQPIQMLVPEYLWEVYTEHREDYFADPMTRSMGLDLELIGRQRDGTLFRVKVTLSAIETGDVLLVNTAAEKMYGYTSREIIGKFIHILNPEDRTGEIGSILAKVKSGQPVEHFE